MTDVRKVVPGIQRTERNRILDALVKLHSRIKRIEDERTDIQTKFSKFKENKELRNENSIEKFQQKVNSAELRYKNLLLQLQQARQVLASAITEDWSQGIDISGEFLKSLNNLPRNGDNCNSADVLDSINTKVKVPKGRLNGHVPDSESTCDSSISLPSLVKSASQTQVKQCHAKGDILRRSISSVMSNNPPSNYYDKTSRCNSGDNSCHNANCKNCFHYHLKLSDIPFVLGKSTTKSHSLPANVQQVFALMKSHNEKLCKPSLLNNARSKATLVTSNSDSGIDVKDDIKQLTGTLEIELKGLKRKQQKIVHKLNKCRSDENQDDLEKKLEQVEELIDRKQQQINHLESVNKFVTEGAESSRPSTTRSSFRANSRSKIKGIKRSKSVDTINVPNRTKSKNDHQKRMEFFKEIRALQNVLK